MSGWAHPIHPLQSDCVGIHFLINSILWGLVLNRNTWFKNSDWSKDQTKKSTLRKKRHSATFLMSKILSQVHQIFPPLTANGSVDATSYIFQHPDISLCQKFAALCFDNSDIVMLDVLQPQKYTWDKGQHLLWMIKVADWNIVNNLLSPRPVLFKIKKILHSYFPLIVPSYLDLSNWYIPATYFGKNVFFTFVLIKDIGICSTDELLVLAWPIEHISLW